jgi:hypothetical protein
LRRYTIEGEEVVSLNPQAAPSLQFDSATPGKMPGVAPAEGVKCAVCQRQISDKYFDINGQPACDRCRLNVARQAETPTGLVAFGKAAVYGLAASILGAIIYYAVIAITNFEIGLVAIAIGFMVGYAVRKATENRGGLRYQLLAVVLTYWAVGLAYTPFLFTDDGEGEPQAQIEPASTGTAAEPVADILPAAAEPDGEPDAAPGGTSPDAVGMALAFGIMFALTWALPVLSVVSSMPGGLISAAIILFGMQQAWSMTAAPNLVITGPFRIAPRPASH